jgi:cytochrome c oxidase subunit 3
MSLTFAYSALACGVLLWLFLVRKLSARSWETPSTVIATGVDDEPRTPASKIGLWVFLCVITSLFGLFISAYYMRMGHGHGAIMTHSDWQSIAKSPILWVNTFLLAFSSVAMQSARSAAARGNVQRTARALLLGGVLAIAFIVGQLTAWRELRLSEYFSLVNPAVAFFYVLTGVHALHLLGGLYVWGRTYWRVQYKHAEAIDVRLSVELASVYWHFLLLVWVVLFILLLST